MISALFDARRALRWEESQPNLPVISEIARKTRWSEAMVAASLNLLPPAGIEELRSIARKQRSRPEVIGFIMPGNIPGAGLHELLLALMAGRGAIVKTAHNEPLFFRSFAQQLNEIDREVSARLAVFDWTRHESALTNTMLQLCDSVVIFGDDAAIESIGRMHGFDAPIFGFGARVSACVITSAAVHNTRADRSHHSVAFDVVAFEQRGCLSPHHIFVGDTDGYAAIAFAARLAECLKTLTDGPLPAPSHISLEDAAAIRRIREQARWRAIGGAPVKLWEGPIPGWTVLYDRDADFRISPGYRTVVLSPFRDARDLERRLSPVKGKLEAVAFGADERIDAADTIEALRSVLTKAGATYLCEPGRMQTPPLDWWHGGGAFLRSLGED